MTKSNNHERGFLVHVLHLRGAEEIPKEDEHVSDYEGVVV